MVPHLTTALTGPILELERKFLESSTQIEHWLRGQWQEYSPPFYSSCDLRNSGFKLAPVDTNLFPGGFNNLNSAFLPLCVQAAMVAIEKICPDARNLLLIPENHTRNQFYLQNVAQLVAILRQTGLNIRLGSMLPEITKPTPIELPNGQSLLLEPLVRTPYRLGLDGFDPCAILLNNDLSTLLPTIRSPMISPRKLASIRGASIRLSRSAAASIFTNAKVKNAWHPTSPPCSTSSRKSTRNTALTRRPTWSSKPMPAPMAWVS